jgi:hypothetical protein
MTLLEAIRSVLRPELVQDGPIELVETAPQSRCQPVKLSKRGRALVLKLDVSEPGNSVNERVFALFNTTEPGINRVCDYIVFYEQPVPADERRPPRDPCMFVFLCELKSANPKGAFEQIRNSRLVSDFIVSMARHHRRSTVRNTAVTYRGLIFSTKVPPRKGATKPGAPPDYLTDACMPDLKGALFQCGITLQLELLCA